MRPPLGQAVWGDTKIELPPTFSTDLRLQDAFTGALLQPQSTGEGLAIPAAMLFDRFPVAVLVPADGGARLAPNRSE